MCPQTSKTVLRFPNGGEYFFFFSISGKVSTVAEPQNLCPSGVWKAPLTTHNAWWHQLVSSVRYGRSKQLRGSCISGEFVVWISEGGRQEAATQLCCSNKNLKIKLYINWAFPCKMQQQSSSQVMPYLYVIVLSFAFYVYDNPIEVGGAVIFIFVLQIRKAQRN